eukprot:767955-Hanusia_phi.AAC.5
MAAEVCRSPCAGRYLNPSTDLSFASTKASNAIRTVRAIEKLQNAGRQKTDFVLKDLRSS